MSTHQHGSNSGLASRAGIIGAILIGIALATSGPGGAATPPCEVSFEPPSILAGSESVTVFFRLSESIGDELTASAPDESGLQITAIDQDLSTITMSTQSAEVGTWEVTFAADGEQTCAGSLIVAEPGRDTMLELGRSSPVVDD